MQGGDLSNIGPQRWLIALEVLLDDRLIPKKGWLSGWDKVVAKLPLDPLVRGRLLHYYPYVTMELVVFGQPAVFVDLLEKMLDRQAWPISYVTPFINEAALQRVLPFRPEVKAVVDVPRRALMWGSLGRGVI